MNPQHRELLASDDWRQLLEELALPFALGDRSYADLGDDVLELAPGRGSRRTYCGCSSRG